MCHRVTCYVVRDRHGRPRYSLDPPHPGAETLVLDCLPDVRVRHSAAGELLAYREGEVYGRPLLTALEAGWCRIAPGREGMISSEDERGET